MHELERMLADRGDPKDDIKRELDISALGVEQGEFASQLIHIKRIQKDQQLGKESMDRDQALQGPELEDINYEQVGARPKEIKNMKPSLCHHSLEWNLKPHLLLLNLSASLHHHPFPDLP